MYINCGHNIIYDRTHHMIKLDTELFFLTNYIDCNGAQCGDCIFASVAGN